MCVTCMSGLVGAMENVHQRTCTEQQVDLNDNIFQKHYILLGIAINVFLSAPRNGKKLGHFQRDVDRGNSWHSLTEVYHININIK